MDSLAAVLLAPVVTKLVDTFRNAFDGGDTVPKVVWNLLAFGIGIAFAVSGDLNLLAGLHRSEFAGEVLTGIAYGAWGSGFHEFFDFLSSKARRP